MQLADNAELAAALAPGQKRYIGIKFMVDWARDGAYADINSDLSELVTTVDIDRQLTGNYPSALEVTEGHAAAQMELDLAGTAPNGIPVWRLFSPYSALYPGTVGAINTPCYLDVIVRTSAGPVTIRQFTGVVRNGVPSRRKGSVHLVVRDASALLMAPVSLDCWAVDSYTRKNLYAGAATPDLEDTGTIVASSAMDHALRRCGFYEGPPWHPNVVLAWSLCGSALPEVGSIGSEDPYINGAWSYGYGQYTIPQFSPSGYPDDIYAPGKYGMCFRGTAMPAVPGGRAVEYLYGNAHSPVRVNPLSFGSNNNNIIGMSFWIQFDATQTGTSQVQYHLEEARYDYSGANRYPAYIQVQVNHATRLVQLTWIQDGWVEMWVQRATIATNGWHHLTAVWTMTSTALTAYLFDGVTAQTLTPYGTQGTWPPTAMSYAWPPSSTNLGQVIANGPMQFVQVFYQHNTPNANYIHPQADPVNPNVHLDLTTLRLLWRPKVRDVPAWDVLRAISSADMGALYITEHGVVTYNSRGTVQARQSPANVAFTLGLDDVMEIDPETALESVVNTVTWTLGPKHTETSSNTSLAVYRATSPDQFEVAANSQRTVPLSIGDDIQSIRLGGVTNRPAAMGYHLDGSANTAWREYMTYYNPSFWADGFTAYGPGTRTDPANQPVQRLGGAASAVLGFVDYVDQDPAHLRLFVASGAYGTIWFSIDDATPFLNIAGSRIVADRNDNQLLRDATSIATYGVRTQTLPGGDLLQDELTVPDLAGSLLVDTKQPRPFFQSLEVIGDPRVQLQDVAQVNDPEGIGGPIYASVVGIQRRISRSDGLSDRYAMRTFGAIGGVWIMDDPSFSIMDVTTIVS